MKILEDYGFDRQRGSVSFGNNKVDSVAAVMETQTLAKNFPWFSASVKDIYMLRIEDNNNLKPVIDMII